MRDFRARTVSGVVWSSTSQGGRQFLRLIIGIILARLLSPREFGLLGMVTVITGYAMIFIELGLGAALIQKKEVSDADLSSVFWLNLVVGLVLTLTFTGLAPLIASFYGESALVPLTIVVSSTFFLGSLGILQDTLLRRDLSFRKLSVAEIASVGIAGVVAITMAVAGFGVWSLAVQFVLMTAVKMILLWFLSSWRPSFVFSWASVRALMGFGMHLLCTQSVHYWTRNVDNLLIGKFLGKAPLGLYSRAYSFLLLPLANISRVISRVLFPSFSKIQEDPARIKRVFLRITRAVAFVTFPLMMGLLAVGGRFVMVVLGPQWEGMVPVLLILCLPGLLQSVASFATNLYLSQGRTDLQFKIGLVLRLNVIVGIVVGLHWGIVGVAAGYATASFLNFYPNLFFAGRLVGMRVTEFVTNVFSVFFCSLVMGALVALMGCLLSGRLAEPVLLLSQIVVGMASYAAIVVLLRIQAYRDIRELVANEWRRRSRRESE